MSQGPEKKPRSNHLELARRIAELTLENGMRMGDSLSEQYLARSFQVSRTLIRAALSLLIEQNKLEQRSGQGYILLCEPSDLLESSQLAQTEEEELATSILRDRMAGRLSNSISISELMRRYDSSRNAIQKALGQLSERQVVQRGAGQSWLFRPLLDNLPALEESLQFRLTMEPEALLAPGFNIDRQRLSLLRDASEEILRKPIEQFDLSQYHDLDVSFHEMIASCSGNRFLSDALLQHQHLRRLPNSLPSVSVHRLQESLREHLRILEQIERGQLEIAADLLKLHLRLSAATRPQTNSPGIPQAFYQRRQPL